MKGDLGVGGERAERECLQEGLQGCISDYGTIGALHFVECFNKTEFLRILIPVYQARQLLTCHTPIYLPRKSPVHKPFST